MVSHACLSLRLGAASEEENQREDDRDGHRVVHRVVRGAALDAALEVLVGEPDAADAQSERRTDGDEHDEVDEAEADAPNDAMHPVTRTLSIGLLLTLGERRQGEHEDGQVDEGVPLPLCSREDEVPASAAVAAAEELRDNPQDGVLVEERHVGGQGDRRCDDDTDDQRVADEVPHAVGLDDVPVLPKPAVSERHVGDGKTDDCRHDGVHSRTFSSSLAGMPLA